MAKTIKPIVGKHSPTKPVVTAASARTGRPCVRRVAAGLSPTLWKAVPRAGQKVILYARSARGQSRSERAALTAQLAACRKWAWAHGGRVVGKYQEVLSGLAEDAPELRRAVAQARAEGAALVCLSFDRLSRNVALALLRLGECQRQGVAIFFVKSDGIRPH